MFTGYDYKALRESPCVFKVDSTRLILRHAFEVELFERWRKDQNEAVIKQMLEENGLTDDIVGLDYHITLANRFKLDGFPDPCEQEMIAMEHYEERNPLILSGAFHRDWYSGKLILNADIKNKLLYQSTVENFETCINKTGLTIVDIGTKKIRELKGVLEKEKGDLKSSISGADNLLIHPYIFDVNNSGISFTPAFYNDAYLLYPLGLEAIFRIFEIDGSMISEKNKKEIGNRLFYWTPIPNIVNITNEQTDRILKKRTNEMEALIENQFRSMGKKFKTLDFERKRAFCRWIRDLPKDPEGKYTLPQIRKLTDISKSTYYKILNDPTYGKGEKEKIIRDKEGFETIKKVIDYKGFKKGIRQIYMLMPKVTGKTMGINRIRDIIQRSGLKTGFKRSERNRKAAKELVERNRRSNLLMRGFRLFKPNEVRLTDVTYLSYGNDKRAYGSASIDPVTSVLVCFIVSEHNDLKLAMDTLEAMDAHPAKTGAILHSDQGMLYMTDDFQSAVKALDMHQSMSRRGNCWDNAPQESFFGHFKRECSYKNCADIEELRIMISDYGLYYNEERGLWDREKMAPLEYESYLNAMTEEEWEVHLQAELEHYEEMKESSAKKVIQRSIEEKAKREEALWEKSI